MALVDMTMSAEEAREEMEPTADDAQKYPYGLSISLDDESLAKLGITSLPEVGKQMTLTARVEVCSTSQYADRKGEAEKSLSLQITAMELSGASQATSSEAAANLLYADS